MTHRKLPGRTDNDISQAFNDGVVEIYTVTDGAPHGRQPRPVLAPKVKLHFAERAFGVQRNYTARQNNVQVEKVVRCMDHGDVSPQDVAIIQGKQYRVDMVSVVPDVYPPCVDITLAKTEQIYEVPV